MPYSFEFFKNDVTNWVKDNIPTHKRVLDVGPGVGTYSNLLRESGYHIDAVEIYEPYIGKYDLLEKYDNVYVEDILNFSIKDYDFIILGDVLEHIPEKEAVDLIEKIIDLGKECLVAVPYKMEQGEHEGNIYETHHQVDLTPEVMKSRYPKLVSIYSNQYYGYYIYKKEKMEKAYVLYANSSYYHTVSAAVKSINQVSKLPVIVYLLNDNRDVEGATITHKWTYTGSTIKQTDYIDRNDSRVYKLLIQRPSIVKHALNNYADTIAYIDSDTVVTPYIDSIFSYFPNTSSNPYFVKGIYDYLFINRRGGVETKEELHKSLEHPACELFGIDQSNRSSYHQTGYFVASNLCMDFLDEWEWMCNHPKVLKNPQYYAPYHEETLANILLWHHGITEGLPYMYMNYSKFVDTHDLPFTGETQYLDEWVRLPAKKEELLALHGEKRPKFMEATMNQFKRRILFLAPHLSTGGMPAFLLKRIEALKYEYEIFVVEHKNYSNDYVVQKNKIKDIVSNFFTLGEGESDLQKIIKDNRIDLVHIDEMSECLDDKKLVDSLYCNCRSYKIVETCHNVSFKPDVEKVYHPDGYAFCTPYHLTTFSNSKSLKKVIEYPIDPKIFDWQSKLNAKFELDLDVTKQHVLNVGLWTKGKNQGEGISLARKLPNIEFHFVGNQAGNFQDYWGPLMVDLPNNVTVWGERDDVDKFMLAADVFMFNSTWECNPLVLREAISWHLPILARNLPQYENMFTPYITDIDSVNIKSQLETILNNSRAVTSVSKDSGISNFTKNHVDFYTKVLETKKIKHSKVLNYNIYRDFALGPYIDIKGTTESKFKIEMYNGAELVYDNVTGVNNWVKLDRSYYVDWRTVIYKDNLLILDEKLNLEGKKVYISFDSSSLGDSIAWIPYVLEFQQKHKCTVTVSTFKNFLFEDVYPSLEFVKPGSDVADVYAMYKIGWFYDNNKEPQLPNTIPLQQTATNILGLEYKELTPKIKSNFNNVIEGQEYVTIATNSTSGCKFWTREGWQDVINFLHKEGYKIINTSIEDNPFDNCEKISDTSIEYTIDCIRQSEFFIGLSSGLSWLAWALEKQVIMISNFTSEDHEFKCHRITNPAVCNGCWNKAEFKFDKGDWNWCPLHKGTERQFECHTQIKSSDVIKEVNKLITLRLYEQY